MTPKTKAILALCVLATINCSAAVSYAASTKKSPSTLKSAVSNISTAKAFLPNRGSLQSADDKKHERANKHASDLSSVARGGSEDRMQRLKIGMYFGLWYALNVFYNLINKKVLNIIPAPLSVGSIQFGVGGLYAALLWITGLRACPELTAKGKEVCWKIGAYHSSGQLLSMVSLGAGPVSFTHIVKALEPFFFCSRLCACLQKSDETSGVC